MVLTVGEDGISGLKDTKVFVQINGKIGRLECRGACLTRGHRNLRCHRKLRWRPVGNPCFEIKSLTLGFFFLPLLLPDLFRLITIPV
uniref:Uncharacterized protein n=1 Tax=Helianthus annuus TaxID=4232 RepID=A0A251SB48_HELAN